MAVITGEPRLRRKRLRCRAGRPIFYRGNDVVLWRAQSRQNARIEKPRGQHRRQQTAGDAQRLPRRARPEYAAGVMVRRLWQKL
jgi:hypothetical protein